MKNEIIYIYDPMCGWCYGFSSSIQKIKEKYGDIFNWQVYSGGMVIGNNALEISSVSEYISEALSSVEKTTGIIFGENFKNQILKSDYYYSSLKPSIALTVFKQLNHDKSISFACDIQEAFFHKGKSLNDINTYLEIIKKYDISSEIFSEMFINPVYEAKTYNEDFRTPQLYKVSGFPVLIVKNQSKNTILSRGYQNYEKLSENIDRLINLGK